MMATVEEKGQEKRITFQLYNYWFGLADGDIIPPLTALSPDDIAAYKNNMTLIDLRDPDNEPTLQVVGQLLNEDMGEDLSLKSISEIPRRSLLSRITDHYMEVLANKSPISFDAEFNNKNRVKILYRCILLPFSDDGENINFILGAIRWISEEDLLTAEKETNKKAPAEIKQENADPEMESEAGMLLQDRLNDCRTLILGKNPAEIRSRRSLYEALGAIFDFHELCLSNPAVFGELLKAEGLKSQKRAPFTPTLKLCFGRNFDKTRLTEYAAALSFAQKNNQNGRSLPDFLDQYPGGIKGCVKAEREENATVSGKTVKNRPGKNQKITHKIIDDMAPIASFDMGEDSKGDDKLCLLLARRNGSQIEVVKILDEDEKILGRIVKQVTNDP